MSKKQSWMLIADYAREGVVWKITSILLVLTNVALAIALAKTAQTPKTMYVVPGAQKAGFYAPGEGSEDIVRDIAERFVLLISTVSNDTVEEINKRSLRYLSAKYKTKFADDQKVLQEAFKAGQVSTLFSIVEDKTTVKQLDDRTYDVQFIGTRDVIDKGEVKETQQYYYDVTVEKTDVTDMNVYGLQISDLRQGPVEQKR